LTVYIIVSMMHGHTNMELRKPAEKVQVKLKSDKNSGYFTGRPIRTDDNTSPDSSDNEKCF